MRSVGVRRHGHLQQLDVPPRGLGVDARAQLQLRADWHSLPGGHIVQCVYYVYKLTIDDWWNVVRYL